MLGTNIGSVHKQRQGTGYATVLQSENFALKDYLLQDDREQAAKAAAAAAKQKAHADAMKALTDFNPERWLKHDKEIQTRMDDWVSQGAQIIANGGNPSNGMDPGSVEWRRKKAEIEALSKASMQMKDMFTATRGKIDGSEADKYDPDAIVQMKDYFDMPIGNIVKGGILPPPLLQAKPSLNLQKTWTGLSKDLYDAKKDKPITDAEKWDFVRASMANNPEINEAAISYLHNLPAAERQRYADLEKKTGKSQIELINYDFMTRYEPGKEAFDLNKFIQQGVDAIDVPYGEYRTPDKFGKYVKKDDFKKSATQKAQLMLTDPQGLNEYQKILPINPGETEGAYRARAVPDLAKRMMDMKAKNTESGVTDKGQGEKEMMVSAEKWLKHIKSADKTLNARAGNYLFETKGVLGNMNITNAEVTDQYSDEMLPLGKNLVLTLEGAPSLQKVEEQVMEAGYSKKDIRFETIGTETKLILPVKDETDNALLRLHDKAFKTGNRGYDAAPDNWSADAILKQGAPATAPKSKF